MTVQVILGLPYLSKGALTQAARTLEAPVLLSANSFSRWRDDGQVPRGWEFNRLERGIRAARGDESPPTIAQSRRRMKEWQGWNLGQMIHADGLKEVHLDSAGFHAQAAWGGYPWTPEAYILGLCAAYPWTRFSSMDLCVEDEVAGDRTEVAERISKTIALNRQCSELARGVGIEDRLMPVIQGSLPDDYLRCFDALSGMIGEDRVIGVGSMCRRKASGEDGIVAVVDALDRALPKGVRLHLFGLKSDGAEAVASLHDRIASIDSQAYGVSARKEANERRTADPAFSKSNEFVAGIMTRWYVGQSRRMADPKPRSVQTGFSFASHGIGPRTVLDAMELHARRQINELIENGDLASDQVVGHHMILEWMADWPLPAGVRLMDPYITDDQLPACIRPDPDEDDRWADEFTDTWPVEDALYDEALT